MRFQKILVDKNEVIMESVYEANSPLTTGKYAIQMIFNGAAAYTIANRELNLYSGNFIFLNQDTAYSRKIDSSVKVDSMSVLFDPDFVIDFEYSRTAKDGLLLDEPEANQRIAPVFVEAIYPLQGDMKFNLLNLKKQVEQGNTDNLLLNTYLEHCLVNYYALYDAEVVNREASLKFLSHTTKSEILRRLSIARDYIISNYNKNICLEEIARIACLSVNHFLRTFKQAYHQSPHQFLTSIRLRQAKYFLKHTDYPVNEIVDIVGFECPSSFIRLFRNSFHITPGQYR
ncbi:AraC family transcriptional regulator [Pedobacter gandavensis]|uniref:helix-turn-helix transcriptional regulator n=1 Tax=Pedobacter TaxID=84567 RepID=UPI001C994ECB|nr:MULTISPECIES: AraC family transcriptional regulator [Pedobacter]WGQ09311.1 AraC family transcriptional regulator [Pedobacter gandavensis]